MMDTCVVRAKERYDGVSWFFFNDSIGTHWVTDHLGSNGMGLGPEKAHKDQQIYKGS